MTGTELYLSGDYHDDDVDDDDDEGSQILQYTTNTNGSSSNNNSFESPYLPTIIEEEEDINEQNNIEKFDSKQLNLTKINQESNLYDDTKKKAVITTSTISELNKNNNISVENEPTITVKSSFASAALKHIRRTSILKENELNSASNMSNEHEEISSIELNEGHIDASAALAIEDLILGKNKISFQVDESKTENNQQQININAEDKKNSTETTNKTKVVHLKRTL